MPPKKLYDVTVWDVSIRNEARTFWKHEHVWRMEDVWRLRDYWERRGMIVYITEIPLQSREMKFGVGQ